MKDKPFVSDLEQIIHRFHLDALSSRLALAKKLLEEPPLIDVAVFGRFKAGKSSFINHLVGRPVLPVGVLPVTSVITRLKYGPAEIATLTFKDGASKTIDIQAVGDYIAEENNPENIKQVESLAIELPSLEEFRHLQITDTPGLGSVFKHNSDTSRNWLPQVGVALVAFSVDPPLSEQDIALIRELKRFTPRITLLLTKIDLVSDVELRQINKFIETQLKIQFNEFLQVWTYSTLRGFENLRTNLLENLLLPLQLNQQSEAKTIGLHKIANIRDECLSLLQISLKASESTDQEKAVLKAKILGEKSESKFVKTEFQILSREYSSRTRNFIMNELTALRPDTESRLVDQLRRDMQFWRGGLWRLSRNFEGWLRETFEKEISKLSADKTNVFLKPLVEAQIGIKRQVDSFQARLQVDIKEALGIEMPKPEFSLEPEIPTSQDISLGKLFDTNIDSLSFIIPMFLFRGLVERYFVKSLPWEIEKNFSRLASQWTEVINPSIAKMANEATVFTTETIRVIESVLRTTTSETKEIVEAITVLEAK